MLPRVNGSKAPWVAHEPLGSGLPQLRDPKRVSSPASDYLLCGLRCKVFHSLTNECVLFKERAL